jgi:hypothetical protein
LGYILRFKFYKYQVIGRGGDGGGGSPTPTPTPTPGPSPTGAEKMRMTIQALKKAINDGATVTGGVINLTAVKETSGDKLRFIAVVPLSTGDVTLAASSGKVETYKSVDDVLLTLAKYQITALGVSTFEVTNVELLDANPYTGDPKVKAAKLAEAMVKTRLAAVDKRDELSASILLMQFVTLSEQALKAERTVQRDAQNGTIAFYDAEIIRLNAIAAA